MTAHTRSLVPFLHVADVERSIAFYSNLGFTVYNEMMRDGGTARTWAWLTSEKANLMLGSASGPIDPDQQAVLFYLYVNDISATHARLIALGHAPGNITYPFYMPGGECRLADPDGYVLMLAEV